MEEKDKQPKSKQESMDKSSPTASGPDSEVASVEDLSPDDQNKGKIIALRDLIKSNVNVIVVVDLVVEAGSEDLTNKLGAGANYLGSVLSSAWTKTAKTANDATASSSSFFSHAFTTTTTTKTGSLEQS